MTPMGGIAIGFIRIYQWVISPLLPRSCRFAPSCSEYAAEAIRRHGILGGSWLALRRILRCHPWGGDGYDPVPDDPWSGRRCQHHPAGADSAVGACSRHPHPTR